MARIQASGSDDPYALRDLVTLSAPTEERERDWLFSEPYLSYGAVIIVREEMDHAVAIGDLHGFKVLNEVQLI